MTGTINGIIRKSTIMLLAITDWIASSEFISAKIGFLSTPCSSSRSCGLTGVMRITRSITTGMASISSGTKMMT